MIILEDTRQQNAKHDLKHKYFEKHGVEVRRTKLYCGDYTLPTDQSVCVDSKRSIEEICQNVCGKEHTRFRRECERAKEAGIKLIVLVENDRQQIGKTGIWNPEIRKLEELHRWANPRLFIRRNGKQLYPNATRGQTLMKACMTMERKYSCRFLFCTPEESGAKIMELLGGKKYGNEHT